MEIKDLKSVENFKEKSEIESQLILILSFNR